MGASYIFRMDDITPGMDWGRFWALMQLFQRHGIKPLLGIVPDNRDPNLVREPPKAQFWDTMRRLLESDAIDVAQHGYQHILVHRPKASILGPTVGIRKEVSEFAGDTFLDQSFRIREGQQILKRHGISTSYWMAPNHSYDGNTLMALRKNGFTALSDGIGLFPVLENGLIFIPQTSWRPRWMPCGIHTICLHTNTIKPGDVKRLRLFLRRPFQFTRFSIACEQYLHSTGQQLANNLYAASYRTVWAIKRAGLKHLKITSQPLAALARPETCLQSEPVPPRP